MTDFKMRCLCGFSFNR